MGRTRKDKKNNIVVYNNDMSDLPLRNMSAKEKDLFFAICRECRDKGTEEISISFERLRDLIGFGTQNREKFIQVLDRISEHISHVSFRWETEDEISRTTLFPTFRIMKKEQVLKVEVNKDFRHILNDLDSNFTDFQLEDYVNFDSGYAKECFRQLRRFKNTGVWDVPIERFRTVLAIPESYRLSDVNRLVITPIENELGAYYGPYGEFSVEKKYSTGRGRPLKSLVFHFPTLTDMKEKNGELSPEISANTSVEEANTDKQPCPKCGMPLAMFKNANGSSFWGHRNYKSGGCRETFDGEYFDEISRKKEQRAKTLKEMEKMEERIKKEHKEELRKWAEGNPEISKTRFAAPGSDKE